MYVNIFIICIFKLGYCLVAQTNYIPVDFIEPNDIHWPVTNLYKSKLEFLVIILQSARTMVQRWMSPSEITPPWIIGRGQWGQLLFQFAP